MLDPDINLPIFLAKDVNVLRARLESVEIQPQDQKEAAKSINELIGKSSVFMPGGMKIRIQGDKPKYSPLTLKEMG